MCWGTYAKESVLVLRPVLVTTALGAGIVDAPVEPAIDISRSNGTRPVNIQRSLTRERFVREREVRRVNA